METDLFKDNLKRIINRGRFGTRTVSVDVLETSLELIEENERLKLALAGIKLIADSPSQRPSNGIPARGGLSSLEGAATIQTQRN
jgi:hypothetical protein